MGTRSITHFKADTGNRTILSMYIQYDGYLTGVGKELKDILEPLALVNGYSGDRPEANGMGCAAAQVVAALKQGTGNVYIHAPNSKDCWEEFVYTIRPAGETFRITAAYANGEKIFDGLISDFDPEALENAENEE